MSAVAAHVAIVGAGVAGLATAKLLCAAGLKTTLFDKGRGLGGRLARRRTEWGNIDIGAPFFHLGEPSMADLSRLAPALALQPLNWRQQVWPQTGVLSAPRLVNDLYAVDGNSNQLCHHLADGLDIELSRRVAALDHQGGGITVWDNGGHRLGHFDAVVVAVPADQCRELLPGSPVKTALPAMQARWSVQLDVTMLPPHLQQAEIICFSDHPTLARLLSLSALPGREHSTCHLQVTLQPDFATQHLGSDDDTVIEAAVAALAEIAPFPRVTSSTLQRWRLGDSLCPALPTNVDTQHGIVVAGDWSMGGNTVDAALRSAERASASIQTLLRRNSTSVAG